MISVCLVARALQSFGKQVRFISLWDDYDVLHKMPINRPNDVNRLHRVNMSQVITVGRACHDDNFRRHKSTNLENCVSARTMTAMTWFIFARCRRLTSLE
jgi:lysyl-tRNA synthetase class I